MSYRHVDVDVLRNTVRFQVSGPRRNSVTRFEIVRALLDCDVPGSDIRSVFRCEAPNAWFATVSSMEQVDAIVDNGNLERGQFCLRPERCDQRRLTIRVQWLPSWISDEGIASHFDGIYGKVVAIEREKDELSGVMLETGTRIISMVIREGDQDAIPYRDRIFGKTALIVVPGRPPICLRCQQVGHVRAQCPGRPVVTAKQSYAAKVTSTVSPEETVSPSPGGSGMETASPSPGGSGKDSTSPSTGGNGCEGPHHTVKRPGTQMDHEGFQMAKKGKHSGASPVILTNGDLAPGQRTPV
ncbi:uncharacterized protein LOC132563995 [Ylistrum balloti]|nr:uncharacterized protein LOC132563995 [Ylistrum balloti]